MSKRSALVFQIRRFVFDDGPGIRTTVFFKGCPLSCIWCHNPEGISFKQEIVFNPARCIGCGDCGRACPTGAVTGEGTCTTCGDCAEACPTNARRLCGTHYTIGELLECLLKDRPFFESSGGGVTLSGGEPTVWMEYAGELSQSLKRQGIDVALQTCGDFTWDTFQYLLLPHLDLVFYDLKLLDPMKHVEFTGVSNETILENLVRLKASEGPEIVVRTPMVPGITDTPENLQGISDFVRKVGLRDYRLLSFNPCIPGLPTQGEAKCRSTSIMQQLT
jgi:pyruvate formate lyase activating enzyme